MRRRTFMALLGGIATWQSPVLAQKAMPVIGFLSSRSAKGGERVIAAFREGLGEAGYVEAKNLVIEYRWAEGSYERLTSMATDLVNSKVDLIVANGGTPPAIAAKNATATIPIVFTALSDPVGTGLVASLAHPGGNVTGINNMFGELTPKLMEFISEAVPQADRIALLINPANPTHEGMARELQQAAKERVLQFSILKASTAAEIDAGIASFGDGRHSSALVIGADGFFFDMRNRLAALVVRNGVPAIGIWHEFAAAGGLMSYGPSITSMLHQSGTYAGRILHGETPADLPVQQPARFELAINLKTAKILGLIVPQPILARADEVIE